MQISPKNIVLLTHSAQKTQSLDTHVSGAVIALNNCRHLWILTTLKTMLEQRVCVCGGMAVARVMAPQTLTSS